jgi:hypothetical protein
LEVFSSLEQVQKVQFVQEVIDLQIGTKFYLESEDCLLFGVWGLVFGVWRLALNFRLNSKL